MEFCNSANPTHQLELKNYTTPFTCDGCKQPGIGPRYRCDKCHFDLHDFCMFPQISPSSHEFFPGSSFKFLRIPPPPSHDHCKRTCDACAKTINGFVYHCDKDDLDLHPCCWNLKKKYFIDGVEFKLHRKVRDKCMCCNKNKTRDDRLHKNGWSYISQCGELHVACITQMITEKLNKRGDGNNTTSNGTDSGNEPLAQENVNLEAIQAQGRERGGREAIQARGRERGGRETIQARGRERGGRGNKYWKIFKAFF